VRHNLFDFFYISLSFSFFLHLINRAPETSKKWNKKRRFDSCQQCTNKVLLHVLITVRVIGVQKKNWPFFPYTILFSHVLCINAMFVLCNGVKSHGKPAVA
jgi:hypothetical protein